ncbi:MAG: ribbon-helix-helix domain-containing protein [Sulfolobales archaeon]|nr:ribbon-helix-helix domain-containing protein [Sulfolobales archaeon]
MASKFEVRKISDTLIEIEIPSRSKTVTLKVTPEELEFIDATARKFGFTNRSEFLRRAVIYYINKIYNLTA